MPIGTKITNFSEQQWVFLGFYRRPGLLNESVMRRLRNDRPYVFRPPYKRKWFLPSALRVNRSVLLGRKYFIREIRDKGFREVAELIGQGNSVIFAPNHADHSDPHVMMEIGRRHGLPLYFMAAREVFEVGNFASWALQSCGVFSVDRDGPDISAIKTALGILGKGDPLVLYPEGEIYHHHERLDPLHEGVASISIKSARRLSEGRFAYIVPVGMLFTHDPSVQDTFDRRLTVLEDRIGWTPRPGMPVDERIIRLGRGVLALKETEFFCEAGQGEIQSRLKTFCEGLLEDVESRRGTDSRATTAPERVRALRYRIRRRLLDSERPASGEERIELLDDLDRVFTALQAHSYIGDYLLEDATLDRRAETVMKLEEDLLGFPVYPAPRDACVVAGEPIPVSEMLSRGVLEGKDAATMLTGILEDRLSELIRKSPC